MDPPVQYVPSPSTLSAWNIILAERDKINLRHHFQNTRYECHIWADDPNKGNTDRHVVGIHTWNPDTEKPEAVTLGYS